MAQRPTSPNRSLLLDVLRDPARLTTIALHEWDRLLPLARALGVLGSVAASARQQDQFTELAAEVLPHLESAEIAAARHAGAVRWELERVSRALAALDVPLVLLKGAAYLAADLPPAAGRTYSDVDLLVPHERLDAVEEALLAAGWEMGKPNPLDRQYYREWLQELPPLIRRDSSLTLDVHHTLLPRRDWLAIPAERLIAAAVPIKDSRYHVLQPADMVLHSAMHLFRNGEFRHGLRDLCDLDRLLRHFGVNPAFWSTLLARGRELRVTHPAYLGLDYAARLFHTPLPADVREQLTAWRPSRLQRSAFGRLIDAALWPSRLDGPDRPRQVALVAINQLPLPRFRVLASPLFWTKRWWRGPSPTAVKEEA